MITTTQPRREAFTLLEVLLASALAVILMAALYVALDVQLNLANSGREAIEQATLHRAMIQRFENDLTGCLGPTAPAISTTAPTTSTTGTATDPAMSEASDPTMMVESDNIPFQAGVIGEGSDSEVRLTMYVSKVVKVPGLNQMNVAPTAGSDIRRVTYWMTNNGLARQEIPWVTSQRLQLGTDPYIEDGREVDSYVIAPEITQVSFSYWDGSAWQSSWDGRSLSSDGVTLRGPPMAIRVHFWMKVSGQEQPKEFRHSIPVLAAPGPAVPDTTEAGS